MTHYARLGAYITVGILTLLARAHTAYAETVTFENPLTAETIPELLDNIANFLLIVAFPIAVIMTIWGGTLIMSAGGTEDRYKKGKQAIVYVVIGVTILILSKGVTSIIQSILGAPEA